MLLLSPMKTALSVASIFEKHGALDMYTAKQD